MGNLPILQTAQHVFLDKLESAVCLGPAIFATGKQNMPDVQTEQAYAPMLIAVCQVLKSYSFVFFPIA